ncbi:MAG: carbohydrate-binding domain-containing protein [Ruminococcus sp.]|nr:carbohydrate-binding domain-containing protein [Ruminococcus sp.]
MKKILCAILCALFAVTTTACTSETADKNSATVDEFAGNSSSDTNAKSTEIEGTELSDGNYDLSFSKRDCNPDYDEATACKIEFSETSAKVSSGNGANAENTKLTINAEGTYIISGNCKDGSIVVNAGDKDKVQIVLKELSLSSKESPLIIQNADKVFITLADDTENTLSDGSAYEAEVEGSTVDSAIFSKSDLTINGNGTLNVNGNYKHSIVSKDDLIITSGTINAKSVTSAIDGKDCLKVKNAEININSNGDGIRSTNTEETDKRGFLYIENGRFNFECANDAIQAVSLLRIDDGEFEIKTGGGSENAPEHTENNMFGRGGFSPEQYTDDTDTESAKGIKSGNTIKIYGGTYNINSSDDAIHSNDNVEIYNGDFKISTGDDGVHSDNTLKIDNGTIKINESYEGIEAGEITIDGGNIDLKSTDDGFNAAGGANNTNNNDFFNANSSNLLLINGGYIYVDAQGDGFDSNGKIQIAGGTVLVNGSSDNNNAAVDCDSSAEITGGVIVALGSSGMASQLEGNGQGAITTSIDSQTEGTSVALTDNDGNIIASLKSKRSFNCVNVSSPKISTGNNYKVVCGGEITGADKNGYATSGTVSGGNTVAEIEMTSNTYFSGGMRGMNGKGGNNKPFKDKENLPDNFQAPPEGMGTPPDNIGDIPNNMEIPPNAR